LLKGILRTASADKKLLKRWQKLGLDPRDLEKYSELLRDERPRRGDDER
jgi:hypothetical protein